MAKRTLLLLTCLLGLRGSLVGGELSLTAPVKTPDKTFVVYAFGHSHIDPAWRWRWWEGKDLVLDTFRQAVEFAEQMNDFHFAQSQAALYAYVEQADPELFARIAKAVQRGQWHPVGGAWVEHDSNLPGGEAMIRQYLVGQRYFLSRFGRIATTGWEPDCFGHTPSLPQILRGAGLKRYVMLRGGKGVPAFPWKGIDGTTIPVVDLGAVLPVIESAFDKINKIGLEEAVQFMTEKLGERGLVSIILPFGVGDHGGGPTREMIFGLRMANELPSVNVPFVDADSGVVRFLRANIADEPIQDELNYDHYAPGQPVHFVFQGCYSSQMRIKQRNYSNEALLRTAEVFSCLSEMVTGLPYPREQIDEAWRLLLFNQFHDILPGSAIHRVYVDAHKSYDRIEELATDVLQRALQALACSASYPGAGYSLAVFNPLEIRRRDPAICILDFARMPQKIVFRSSAGDSVPGQVLEWMRVYEKFYRVRVVFLAEVPPLGYQTYAVEAYDGGGRPLQVLDHLSEPLVSRWHPEIEDSHTYWNPMGEPQRPKEREKQANFRVQSRHFEVEIDRETGGIVHLISRESGWDAAPAGASLCRLQIVGDNSGGYTAWRLRLTDYDTVLTPSGEIRVLSKGPVLTKIRIPYSYGDSRFRVDITVYNDLPRVELAVHSEWRERLKDLRMLFPVNVEAAEHTRSIPLGAFTRPNDGVEEPAQRWIDVSDGVHGVAVLNRNTPGTAVDGNTVSITLLRSPVDPDPVADVGEHHAVLAVYPHQGRWSSADPGAQALRLSYPLIVVFPDSTGEGPPSLSLAKVDHPGVRITSFKRAEEGTGYVIRLAEQLGRPAEMVRSELLKSPDSVYETDFLERVQRRVDSRGPVVELSLKPFQIRTLLVKM